MLSVVSHVSQLSHTNARKKIEVKVALLEFWGRTTVPWKVDTNGQFLFDQSGNKILEYVPVSENDVRRWKADFNNPGVISQTLAEMLRQDLILPDHLFAFDSYDAAALTPGGIQKMRNKHEKTHYINLKQNLRRALKILELTKQRQLESENKGGQLTELHARLRVMEMQRASAAQQSLVDRKELRDSLHAWREKEGKLERRNRELSLIIAAKDDLIAGLEGKISEFVRERQKLVGLNGNQGGQREN